MTRAGGGNWRHEKAALGLTPPPENLDTRAIDFLNRISVMAMASNDTCGYLAVCVAQPV